MANILIASLGESPIVVTAMVKALKEKNNIQLDKVVVLYPGKHPNIKDGVTLIEEHSLCENIEPHVLPFRDANTSGYCHSFLRILHKVLEIHQSDTFYLSLAGGRKSMSALMFLFAPFYENIKGLYHILDKNEGDQSKRNFYSIEELIGLYIDENKNLNRIMNPPSDDLNLIEIPFEHFADAEELRGILKTYSPSRLLDGVSVSLDNIEPDAVDFWAAIFQKREAPKRDVLNIRFSQTAYDQYLELRGNPRKTFRKYFEQMQYPNFIAQKKHGTFGGKGSVFHFCKLRRTGERPFFYQQDKQVVIAQLTYKANNSYQQLSDKLEKRKYVPSATEYEPVHTLKDIDQIGDILLAAVGKSPMVVTQAYTLLQRDEENAMIDKVALVFPEKNGTVKKGIRMLKDVFRKRAKKTAVIEYGAALQDVADEHDCATFFNRMIHAIDDLRKKHPDSQIRLLLSGGRKGMTALSYFAAQRSEITKVYHTLITDPELEKRIESECSTENLNRLGSPKKKAEKMFLECYPLNDFDLFEIPVIPLRLK